MRSSVPKALAGPEQRFCSAELIRNSRHLTALYEDIRPLLEEDCCLLRPDFFLASVSPKDWIPRVVVVRKQGQVIGALYAKERKLAGVPTGILYGDGTLHGVVVAEAPDRRIVLQTGLRALVRSPRTLGVRLLLPPGGYEAEALQELVSEEKLDYAAVPWQNHLVLPLCRDYESFLARLGTRTRRNLRYYRRKSEQEGNIFVGDVPLDEFRKACAALLRQNVVGADHLSSSRALDMFACSPRPILIGLRDQEGHWISILGGWVEGARAISFFQMNSDKHHKRMSLSVVLRSYFIEGLIKQGFRSVVFWAGVSQPFNHYATAIPTISVYLDKRYKGWSIVRHLLASGVKKLPRSMAWSAKWLVPDVEQAVRTTLPLP